MRKIKFVNENFYHVYNRGVDKRQIFSSHRDYFRFIHNLYEFNDHQPVSNVGRVFIQRVGEGSTSINTKKKRVLLVDIICFSLMPNHFHLILRQLVDGGITKFMQKLGTGYTMYFNQIHQRSGALFEGPFKGIHIEKDEYLMHLSRYIHLNPIELKQPDWKEKGLENWRQVSEFLRAYRWSSYLDYIGEKNFPSVINKDFILEYFGNKESYGKFMEEWLVGDLKWIEEVILE